jgi:hypothetical protein
MVIQKNGWIQKVSGWYLKSYEFEKNGKYQNEFVPLKGGKVSEKARKLVLDMTFRRFQ